VKYTNLSNLIDILYQMNGFARYPLDLYQGLGALTFSVAIPLTIMVTVPAKLLAHTVTLSDFVLLFTVTAAFLITTRMMWKFALRFYTSASG
jgi:ABC-2 type transport system permease protein